MSIEELMLEISKKLPVDQELRISISPCCEDRSHRPDIYIDVFKDIDGQEWAVEGRDGKSLDYIGVEDIKKTLKELLNNLL